MKIMIFDTETADMIENTDKSILAEISYLFFDFDKKTLFFESEYIKPEIEMNPWASSVNNITNVDIGLEPDINGNIKEVPLPEESKVLQRFIGGINKYKTKSDFYLMGYNIKNFDFEVIRRALKQNEIFQDVNVIDLYRISKYFFYTDKGREFIQNKYPADIPESASLQYLKYFYKLYREKEKMKNNKNLSRLISNNFDTMHGALSDTVDTFILFNFYYKIFDKDIKKMHNISNNIINIDYLFYGYDKGKRIDEISSNRLLNILTRVTDEDLAYSIINKLLLRHEDKEIIIKANKNFKYLINKILNENNIDKKIQKESVKFDIS